MKHSISLSRGLIFLMAVTSGFTVANVYFNQTLLVSMAGTFHVTAAQAGMIATLAQIGYAAGICCLFHWEIYLNAAASLWACCS